MKHLILTAVCALTTAACVETLDKTAVVAGADASGTSAACKAQYPEPIVMTTPDEQLFASGVLQPDGTIVAAHVLKTTSKSFSRLMQFNTAGPTGKLDIKLDTLTNEEVYTVLQDGDGWVMNATAFGKDDDPVLIRVSQAGVAQVTAVDLGGSEQCYGLAKAGANYVLTGRHAAPTGTKGFLIVLDGKGKCLQGCDNPGYDSGAGSANTSLNGVELLPGGDFLVAGETLPSGGKGGLDGGIWRIASDGNQKWVKVLGSNGEDWFWSLRAAAQPEGGFVAYGKKAGQGWLVALDAQGEPTWDVSLPETKDVFIVAPMPYGWVVGALTAGGQRLLGIDGAGHVLWQQSHLGKPYSILRVPTGLAVVGDLQGDARILFTDPWGNATCASAGKCAGILTCDDNKACTDDVCGNTTGCTHAAANDGQPCDDGVACTAGDVCGSGQCAGKAKVCDDGKACSVDSCDPKTGQCSFDASKCP